ncbi:hypothetical protein [Halegenticoccus soli]|uniref:hypothetical protein n=1 Tax=Halegenticoccus soli TaxID=1985678 RepID=UPI00117A0F45|nr:hypothetical protein [Halegenticoccus soli]
MKKALRILMALVVVGTVFTAGFAGSAAALDFDFDYEEGDTTEIDQNQESDQNAEATVEQDQDVDQSNDNLQAGASVGIINDGDQSVEQSSEQVNYNDQEGAAAAGNFAEQTQEADA